MADFDPLDKPLFQPDLPETDEAPAESLPPWKLLVVDDEPQIHTVTRLVLGRFTFAGRPLQILSAASAADARAVLWEHRDVAVILLDVVMETDAAGLDLIRTIRSELGNLTVRIVVRTGQPGVASESAVMAEYDIGDFLHKAELSAQRIITVVTGSLRAYSAILTAEESSRGFENVVFSTIALSDSLTREEFLGRVLPELASVLEVPLLDAALLDVPAWAEDPADPTILTASGRFAGPLGAEALSQEIRADALRIARGQKGENAAKRGIYPMRARAGHGCALVIDLPRQFRPLDDRLIDMYLRNAGGIYQRLGKGDA